MSTIIACGRLGRDAELRTTNGGTKIASFSIADEIGWGDKKRTQWLNCALFGDRAEKIVQYLTKGTLVEVVGVPSVRTWEKDGKAAGALEITVSEVKLHGGGKKDEPVADRGRATRGNSPSQMDDDIPFSPEWR